MSAFLCALCALAAGGLYRLGLSLIGKSKKITRTTLVALDACLTLVCISAAAAACFFLFAGYIPYYAPFAFIFGFICVALFV